MYQYKSLVDRKYTIHGNNTTNEKYRVPNTTLGITFNYCSNQYFIKLAIKPRNYSINTDIFKQTFALLTYQIKQKKHIL